MPDHMAPTNQIIAGTQSMTCFPWLRAAATFAVPLALAAGGTFSAAHAGAAAATPIRHVVIIMQENRSFDHYFGTFPGADGIPPNTCVPLDPRQPSHGCIVPFHDPHDVNAGGPHGPANAQADLDDGIKANRMDGFLKEQAGARDDCKPDAPACSTSKDGVARNDAVGYHTEQEIPNYWTYAKRFVLQDQMFEGVRSWSWPSHLDLTSEWVATCTDHAKASSCTTNPNAGKPQSDVQLPWANLFQLLDTRGVSWKYYLGAGEEPDCEDGELTCNPENQSSGVPSIWNPAPYFAWVRAKGPKYLRQHNPEINQFLIDVKQGTLPQVSWVVPSNDYSEHPPAGVTRGMEYVTAMVNAVMRSPYWKDTVIFLSWDDWGGFYDHVVPPNVETNGTGTPIQGFGLRVPGLTISAYAKAGMIDHQLLSLDSYATFIEDLFMNGARLNPTALGIPDQRPNIRDSLTRVQFPDGSKAPIGDLMKEFDFKQKPLRPILLSTHIPTEITVHCSKDNGPHCTSPAVTVTWQPVGTAKTQRNFTYHVTRDGQELSQCAGTGRSCTDRPGKGAHLYRVYSLTESGVASPPSAAAEADEP
jgi:phospholipase C